MDARWCLTVATKLLGPNNIGLSPLSCLTKIFMFNLFYYAHGLCLSVCTLQRITIPEIKIHPWFLQNLPIELIEGGSWQSRDVNNPSQSIEEVLSIIQEARKPALLAKAEEHLLGGSMDLDDLDADADLEDIETSGDFVCPL